MSSNPLRYRISSWSQLPDCVSNNSRKLHIEVSEFMNNVILTGTRIQIVHEDFGVLFACVVRCAGNMITPISRHPDIVQEFSPNQILAELSKYGFIIEYKPAKHLPSSQLDLLIQLSHLGYDKIRILNVYEWSGSAAKEFKWRVVGFKVGPLPYWLNSDYAVSENEYTDALEAGNAINISAITDNCKWDWSWLYGYVVNIQDILEENA